MKLAILFLTLALVTSWAQAPSVNVMEGPSPNATILVPFDSSTTLQYLCYARYPGPTTTVTKSAASLTNIVVSTNVATVTTLAAHGMHAGGRVTVSGATVDTDLNGTYTILTVPTTTTYTFTTVAVADATYTDAGLVITTVEPLLTASLWAIKVLRTTSDSTIPIVYWANGVTIGFTLACSARATY